MLLGASKLTQLEDNLRAIDLMLTPEEVHQLDEASPHADYYPKWFNERLRDPMVSEALGTSA